MKIFFTTPFPGKKLYQKEIDTIIKIIEASGATVVSPEKPEQYQEALSKDKQKKYGNKKLAHYEFVRQNIASADAIIFESSYEDFRVGHEATLGLMYDKPVLVLSQNIDYSEYISHEKLYGKKYQNTPELIIAIKKFLEFVDQQSKQESFQVIDAVVDLQHSAALSKTRYKALQGKDYFSDWAKRAVDEPEKVYQEVLAKLGNLSIQPAWDVFAKIYNQDTPDQVFYGAVRFADKIFRSQNISKTDSLVDVATGTGAVSRLLTSMGYRYLTAFDQSRAMLAEAYKLCSHLPSIKIIEAKIQEIQLNKPARGMVWFDFSSNFAAEKNDLKLWLNNLLGNLDTEGLLIFDVRTKAGWQVDFFKQKITCYETDNFQRLWVNLPDYQQNTIKFDIFIRIKDKNGQWLSWEREQMKEKMWSLQEIKDVIDNLQGIELLNIFSDDFTILNNNSPEPGLAYFVLRKK